MLASVESIRYILEEDNYLVGVKLAVGTDIKQAAGGVVGTGSESVAVREELNSVDIGLVASECLNGLAGTDIPQFSEGVASTGNEDVLVGWVDADRHHVTEMVGELGNLGPGFNIPQHTSHVTRGGNDAAVVNKATAGEVSRVSRELARDTGWTFARRQVVN